MQQQPQRVWLGTMALIGVLQGAPQTANARVHHTSDTRCRSYHVPQQCAQALPSCARAAHGFPSPGASVSESRAQLEVVTRAITCELELDQLSAADVRNRGALAWAEQHLAPDDVMRIQLETQLGWVLLQQDRNAEAEPIIRRALAAAQGRFGERHEQVSEGLNHLAMLHLARSEYAEAERVLRRELATDERLYGSEHEEVASCLNNLAVALQRQASYAEAERIFRRAFGILRRVGGVRHARYAATLSNLATVLERQGKYAEAELLQREAVRAARIRHPGDSEEVAMALNNLALLLEHREKYDAAEQMHRQSTAMVRRLQGEQSIQFAVCLHNLAVVLDRKEKYAQAQQYHQQSLDILKGRLGPQHSDVAKSWMSLGSTLLRAGRIEAGRRALTEATAIHEVLLQATISEPRTRELLASIQADEEEVFSLPIKIDPSDEGRSFALSLVLTRKGRVAEMGAIARRLLRSSLDIPSLQPLYGRWEALRQERERILYGIAAMPDGAARAARLEELRVQADSLEAQLVHQVPNGRALKGPSLAKMVASVAMALPPDATLVEVVQSRLFQGVGGRATLRWSAPHYIAFLLSQGPEIRSVDLGDAHEIDEEVRQFLSALQNPHSYPVPTAQALYQKLFSPLFSTLMGAREVLLSLDGSLQLVPFHALHDGTDYLLGRIRFRYVTTGRAVLHEASARTVAPAMILANPAFGNVGAMPARMANGWEVALGSLPPLPAAEQEAQQISSLLGVAPLLGSAAQEAIVHRAHAPWILHIATHGIQTPAALGAAATQVRSSLSLVGLSAVGTGTGLVKSEDVHLEEQTALLLAPTLSSGAISSPKQDGLLTAEDSRMLDLEGTQLVTLSACQTGRGEPLRGQGVQGLRHAFIVAGAETVVTSLWRIDDRATGELMVDYYRRLLNPERPADRVGALADAMAAMRHEPGRSHPYFWAPFLVIGQAGPLRRVGVMK